MLKLRPPSRCSATRCLQRSAPVNGSTVLITGASFRLRSVGRCQRQHGAGGRLCQYRWRRKEKLFLRQKGFLRTCTVALRLPSPDLLTAKPSEDRERRFSHFQACGSGKARFALVQYPMLRRSAFRLWASALSAHLPALRMPALSYGKRQKETFPAFSAPR